jgi:hypothetical protein
MDAVTDEEAKRLDGLRKLESGWPAPRANAAFLLRLLTAAEADVAFLRGLVGDLKGESTAYRRGLLDAAAEADRRANGHEAQSRVPPVGSHDPALQLARARALESLAAGLRRMADGHLAT